MQVGCATSRFLSEKITLAYVGGLHKHSCVTASAGSRRQHFDCKVSHFEPWTAYRDVPAVHVLFVHVSFGKLKLTC